MRSWQGVALVAILVVAAVVAILAPPITRGTSFHVYADQRTWLGIPQAGDVLSNLPFVVAGGWGLLRTRHPFFLTLVAVGVGSGAYHVAPGDGALVFDWAPIVLTLGFLAALVVADRIAPVAGRLAALTFPLVALAAVVVWYLGGGTGSTTAAGGDMRWYVLTQATFVLVVAATSLAPAVDGAPARLDRRWILLGVAGFVAARALAAADRAMYEAVGVSGHSAKHVLLGLAAACLVPSLHVQRGEGARSSARGVREAGR